MKDKSDDLTWKDYAIVVFALAWSASAWLAPDDILLILGGLLILFGIMILIDWFVIQPIKHKRATKRRIELLSRSIVVKKKPINWRNPQ